MANACKSNFQLNSSTHAFSGIWALTRTMKKAGWNVMAHSDGTTKTAAGTNGNDSWGSNADPFNDTYPAFDSAAAWIVMSGPVTVKVPITAASTGTFLRNEKVTQTGSGAEGEVLGYVFDSTGSTGWLVLADRTGVSASYTNSWTTGVITGASSGATLTPSATPKAFVREVVFWKNSANVFSGNMYYICADASAENASLFSVLAASAGCTATIAPAGGGTGNAFPALALCVRGTGGSATFTNFFGASSSIGVNTQIVAADATHGTGVTADGTFWITSAATSLANGTVYFFGFFRLDDTEPGDVEPFIWAAHSSDAPASFSRTAATTFTTNNTTFALFSSTGTCYWRGYVARGTGGSKDIASYFVSSGLSDGGASATPALTVNSADVQRVANYPTGTNVTAPIVREPVRVFLDKTGAKMYKGATRWMSYFPIGSTYDMFDTKQWMVFIAASGTANGAIAIGPYDGVNTPTP